MDAVGAAFPMAITPAMAPPQDEMVSSVNVTKGYILRKLVSIMGDDLDIHLQFTPTDFRIFSSFQDGPIANGDRSTISNSIIAISASENNNINDIMRYVSYRPPANEWFNVIVDKSQMSNAMRFIRTADGRVEIRLMKNRFGNMMLQLEHISAKNQAPLQEVAIKSVTGPEIIEITNKKKVADISASKFADLCESACNGNITYCKVTVGIVNCVNNMGLTVAHDIIQVTLHNATTVLSKVVWCSIDRLESHPINEWHSQFYHQDVFKRLAPLKTSFSKSQLGVYIINPEANMPYNPAPIHCQWKIDDITVPQVFGRVSKFHLLIEGIVHGIDFKMILI